MIRWLVVALALIAVPASARDDGQWAVKQAKGEKHGSTRCAKRPKPRLRRVMRAVSISIFPRHLRPRELGLCSPARAGLVCKDLFSRVR